MSDVKIKIIGAGFSGLVQAFYLVEKGLKVQIIEKNEKQGGLLGSKIEKGFLVEQAANAFVANLELERICQIIQVDLVATKKEARKRFIYRNNQMRRWPLSILQFIKLIYFMIKSQINFKSKGSIENQTVKDWVGQNLDLEFNDYLVEPILQGVFASSAQKLNAKLIAQALFQKHKKGKLRGSVAPRYGMQDFIDKMTVYLKKQGCEFRKEDYLLVLKEKNIKINQDENEVKSSNRNEKVNTNAKLSEKIIWAIGLTHLKEFYEQNLVSLPDSILKTQTTSLSSVKLLFYKEQIWTKGFGCLFPKKEGFNSLGVLFNHNIFPDRAVEGSSETWILNDESIEFSKMSENALLRYVMSDRMKVAQDGIEPDQVIINQWTDRIPLYDHFLLVFINDLKKAMSPDYFIGNYLGSLGLSKILFIGKENAEKVMREIHV